MKLTRGYVNKLTEDKINRMRPKTINTLFDNLVEDDATGRFYVNGFEVDEDIMAAICFRYCELFMENL